MDDLQERPFKRMKQEEPEVSAVKWNDLPDLAFEKIISYLNLDDQIKARAVSRRWYNVINSFRPKSLCYSGRPIGFLYQKHRWVSGEFARNFISSLRFDSFFQTFGQSIFSNLKHLHLGNLVLNTENFAQILNSFDQLEELVLFQINRTPELGSDLELHLNLPMLKIIHLENVKAITKVTLDAPRLQEVNLKSERLSMNLVHGESIEKLILDKYIFIQPYGWITAKSSLKNLRYFYSGGYAPFRPTTLSGLKSLKEIHLKRKIGNIFKQKEQYGCVDLKIFYRGFLLNSADDPAIESVYYDNNKAYLVYLIENQSRLADVIPHLSVLAYSKIEAVASEQRMDLLKRFNNLEEILVQEPVQDTERFLNLLKSLNNVVALDFTGCNHRQELFDRLPDECEIQSLKIANEPADLSFLFRLKSLIHLTLRFSIDIEMVRKVLKELPFVCSFNLRHLEKSFIVKMDHSKQLSVCPLFGVEGRTNVADLNAAIQFISQKAQQE